MTAKIAGQFRIEKPTIRNFLHRKNMRRRCGRSRPYTTVQIVSLTAAF